MTETRMLLERLGDYALTVRGSTPTPTIIHDAKRAVID